MKVSPAAMIFKFVRAADSLIIISLYSLFFILYSLSGGAASLPRANKPLPPPRY